MNNIKKIIIIDYITLLQGKVILRLMHLYHWYIYFIYTIFYHWFTHFAYQCIAISKKNRIILKLNMLKDKK